MTTYTSQPDETASQDTWVREAAPDEVEETTDNALVYVRGAAGGRRIALLKFDLSSIPAGSTINSATLSLWIGSADAGGVTISARRVLSANSGWVEGATWNYANPSTVRWAGDTAANGGSDAGCSVAGTDFSSTAMGSVTTGTITAGTQYDFTLDTTEVALMLANNAGITLQDLAGSGTTTRFSSAANATAGLRPKLVIDYTAATGVHMRRTIYARSGSRAGGVRT